MIWKTSHFEKYSDTVYLENQCTRIEYTPDDQYLMAFSNDKESNITVIKVKPYYHVI